MKPELQNFIDIGNHFCYTFESIRGDGWILRFCKYDIEIDLWFVENFVMVYQGKEYKKMYRDIRGKDTLVKIFQEHS